MNPVNNFQNPFESIMAQMNNAKSVYDNTIASLQNQMQQVRQQMSVFQQPFNPASQIAAQPNAQPVSVPDNQSSQQTVPTGIEQISVLGEIKSAIEKTNELLSSFINGVPVSKEKKEVKDEGAKK